MSRLFSCVRVGGLSQELADAGVLRISISSTGLLEAVIAAVVRDRVDVP